MDKQIKTFKDLVFFAHPVGIGLMAQLYFKNGYGISIVRFSIGKTVCSYTSGDEWEAAIMKNGRICYDTPITNDVIGNLMDDGVTELMRQIQGLPGPVDLTNPNDVAQNQ